MRNTWNSIRRTQSAPREARVRARVEQEMERLPLAELRKARSMTQARLSDVLHVNQGAISKIEQRSDMYLSTLRSYVEAMGGSLDIRAVFPEGEIVIERLTDVKRISRRKVIA
ncbi:MAG TPA: XRE family transcriptional regulator [Terracidiphilus sp.]|nr:XRE family transcriptional regulator [Terracidiphilus sp.]